MSEFSEKIVRDLLTRAIQKTLEDVQAQVTERLPPAIHITLDAFEQQGKDLSLDEIFPFLYKDGAIPRIIDVAVKGVKEEHTIIWIRPSGHSYVREFAQTWNKPAGMGPFKSIGLMLPRSIWQRPRPLSLQDLREAAEK